MKYHVALDGETVVVEIVDRGGRTFVVKDGVELPVELAVIRNGAYSLLMGDQSLPVVASGGNDDLTLTLGSETWHCSVQSEREAQTALSLGAKEGRKGAGLIRAVMPGIVREVLVRVGDAVVRSAPLLILEAMKMQNEVRADTEGTVAELHVSAGMAVAKGDPLVTLR